MIVKITMPEAYELQDGGPLEDVKDDFLEFLCANCADIEDILGLKFEVVEE